MKLRMHYAVVNSLLNNLNEILRVRRGILFKSYRRYLRRNLLHKKMITITNQTLSARSVFVKIELD